MSIFIEFIFTRLFLIKKLSLFTFVDVVYVGLLNIFDLMTTYDIYQTVHFIIYLQTCYLL